jgi:hypothetical protein
MLIRPPASGIPQYQPSDDEMMLMPPVGVSGRVVAPFQ